MKFEKDATMTPLSFAIIGLRLMGIYFIVESVPLFATGSLIGTYMAQLSPGPGSFLAELYSSFLLGGVQVLIGLLLLIFSTKLAQRIILPLPKEPENFSFTLDKIQATAFAAVGLIILAYALPSIGHAVKNLYYCYVNQAGYATTSSSQLIECWIYAAGVFGQVIMALVLVLYPRGFRNGWHWLRTAGTKPSDEAEGL